MSTVALHKIIPASKNERDVIFQGWTGMLLWQEWTQQDIISYENKW